MSQASRDNDPLPKVNYKTYGAGSEKGKNTKYTPDVLDRDGTTTYHGVLNGPVAKAKNYLGGKRVAYYGPQPTAKSIPGESGGSLTGSRKSYNKGQAL